MNEIAQETRANRTFLQDWSLNALSDEVRQYRLSTLASAFGLRENTIEKYLVNEVSIGMMLVREMVAWCKENPDVSPNNPAQNDHWIKSVDLNGS